jgi:hypothetical protein
MSIYDKSSLVLIPSGTKTGKIFSQKPVSGDGDFTFTRASAATRVNADGNIEKETSNLLLQSNQLDTSWDKVGITTTSGQSGYDGSNDAWLITKTPASYERIRQNNTSSGVLTASVYAKANTLNQVTIYCFVSGSNAYAKFSLVDGSVVLSSSIIDSSATNVGNGWWRLSITFNDTLQSINIYPDLAETTAGSIYIQDAQLEQGLVARDYIETTTAAVYGGITDNTPRLDYTDSSCPALLLEPQRTNIFAQSEYYNTYWNHTNSSVSNNQLESPEGFINASVLSATSPAQSGINVFNTWSDSTTYTMSAFVKKKIGSYIGFGVYGNAMGDEWIKWNLDNGTSTATNLWTNADFEDFGNGWYRISATIATTSGSTSKSGFKLNLMTNTSYSSGNVGDEAYIYGLQLEQGSYATSYIPTYESSVSRVADEADCSDNGITSNVGTWYIEFGDLNSGSFGSSLYSILINPQSGNQYISFLSNQTQNTLRVRVNDGTSTQYVGPSFSIEEVNKYLIKWDGTNLQFFRNGSQYASVSFTSTQAFSYINLPNPARAALYPIKQVLCFPTALTDQEAIDLTTI